MTNFVKIAIVSLAILSGVSAAQAGNYSDKQTEKFFEQQTLNGN